MKLSTLIIGLALSLSALPSYAGGIMMMGGGVKASAPSGPNVTFYFNCDSATSGQSPTVGSGTVTIGASATATTGQVSNAIDNNNTDYGGARIAFASAGNISASAGTIGFWLYTNAVPGNGVFYLYSIYDPYINFALVGTVTGALRFYWNGEEVTSSVLSISTWYFVEIAWSDAADEIAMRINGGSWSTAVSTDAAPNLGSVVQIGGSTGYSGVSDSLFDQILVSDEYQADLYSVRDSTSF